MPDPQLQAIVERMVQAGESEDNIALVIQEYKPATTTSQFDGAIPGEPPLITAAANEGRPAVPAPEEQPSAGRSIRRGAAALGINPVTTDTVIGAGKSVLNAVRGGGNLIRDAVGVPRPAPHYNPDATSMPQQVGKTAMDIAQFITPHKRVMGAMGAGAKLLGMGRTGNAVMRIAGGTAKDAAVGAAQSGDLSTGAKTGAGTAAIETALQLPYGRMIRPLGKALETIPPWVGGSAMVAAAAGAIPSSGASLLGLPLAGALMGARSAGKALSRYANTPVNKAFIEAFKDATTDASPAGRVEAVANWRLRAKTPEQLAYLDEQAHTSQEVLRKAKPDEDLKAIVRQERDQGIARKMEADDFMVEESARLERAQTPILRAREVAKAQSEAARLRSAEEVAAAKAQQEANIEVPRAQEQANRLRTTEERQAARAQQEANVEVPRAQEQANRLRSREEIEAARAQQSLLDEAGEVPETPIATDADLISAIRAQGGPASVRLPDARTAAPGYVPPPVKTRTPVVQRIVREQVSIQDYIPYTKTKGAEGRFSPREMDLLKQRDPSYRLVDGELYNSAGRVMKVDKTLADQFLKERASAHAIRYDGAVNTRRYGQETQGDRLGSDPQELP